MFLAVKKFFGLSANETDHDVVTASSDRPNLDVFFEESDDAVSSTDTQRASVRVIQVKPIPAASPKVLKPRGPTITSVGEIGMDFTLPKCNQPPPVVD